jgi:hypothetical protein
MKKAGWLAAFLGAQSWFADQAALRHDLKRLFSISYIHAIFNNISVAFL